MFCRTIARAALVLSLLAGLARAQQASVYDKSQDDRLTALEKRVKDAESNLANQKADLDQKLEALTKLVAAQTANVGKLTDTLGDQKSQIQSLTTDLTKLTSDINTELSKIEKNLADISRNDGGRYVPNISAAMEQETFRQDMEAAVNRSLKTEGVFRIVNKTPTHQWISVNRTEYFLQPGETLTLRAPVGTVTTRLPGQELMNWTLAAPNNSESIDIVPTIAPPQPTVAARPIFTPPPSSPQMFSGADYAGSNLWTNFSPSAPFVTYP